MRTFLGYTRLTASVKASQFCSSWASRSFCWDKKKCRLLIETEQIKGGKAIIKSHQIPQEFLVSSYLQQFAFSGVWESREHLLVFFNSNLWRHSVLNFYHNSQILRTEPQRYKLALALSSSTMKWQREALKKYSLALYFSNGLSIVLAPTYMHPHRTKSIRNVSIAESVLIEKAQARHSNTSSAHLLVDLDSPLVLLQLSTVPPHFQQTLVGRAKEQKVHNTFNTSQTIRATVYIWSMWYHLILYFKSL